MAGSVTGTRIQLPLGNSVEKFVGLDLARPRADTSRAYGNPRSGFGRQVNNALSRRAQQRLVERGHAITKDGNIHIPVGTVARQEVERVRQPDGERGRPNLRASKGGRACQWPPRRNRQPTLRHDRE
jgi:hypothetical protein